MPSTNMSDIVTAKSLAGHAVNNPEARHEYFDFLKSLREKYGPEYSTMVHQYSSKLLQKDATPVSESEGGPVEAYGVKGLNSTRWQKTFRNADALHKWAEANDAEVSGMREADPQYTKEKRHAAKAVTEAKGLHAHVKIVKGNYAGQTGYVRQIKTDKIRNKVSLDIDLEDGGQTVEPKENCRIIKNVDETIVKTGSQYELKSHSGKNLGKYPTRAGAEKREKQVNYFKHMDEETDTVDAITVDIPLMIRLMEYAKEDAADDMALHQVAERLTELSQEGRTLTMNDYDAICSTDNTQGI